ncbi:MAG: DotH/IcmK family type IV secretion protein [Pseudomonadota bacterium]
MKSFLTILMLMAPILVLSQDDVAAKNNSKSGKEDYITLRLPIGSVKETMEAEQRLKAATDYLMTNKAPLPAKLARKLIDKKMNDTAIIKEILKPGKFVSNVVYASLQPGSESIKIDLSLGLPITVLFKDVKGNPVNVYSFDTPKEHFIAYKPGYSTESGAGNTGKQESQESIPNNLLIISAKLPKGGANMPVFTTVSEFPLSFDVTINKEPGKEYVDRLVVVVDNGQNDQVGVTLNELEARNELMRVLNNLPPSDDAENIRFNQGIKAWKQGNYLWIRTKLRLFYPVHSPQNAASLNGVTVYKTKYSPVISVMNNEGKIMRLKRKDV